VLSRTSRIENKRPTNWERRQQENSGQLLPAEKRFSEGKMMVTILFVWTVVAAGGSTVKPYADWRVLAEFSTPAACQSAIKELSLPTDRARCVAK
jgi:hypothetical protein